MQTPLQYRLSDNGIFPNSHLPALLYKKVFTTSENSSKAIIQAFAKNNWTNNWTGGVYTYHHYHSITHEALGIYKGQTVLQLGGEDGIKLTVEAGDVLIIPAGVAHKNLGKENDISCVGGYPNGQDFDINKGNAGERPGTDRNIAAVPLPETDPVTGKSGGLTTIWKSAPQQKED